MPSRTQLLKCAHSTEQRRWLRLHAITADVVPLLLEHEPGANATNDVRPAMYS